MKARLKPVLIVGTAFIVGAAGTFAYADWMVPVSQADLIVDAATMPPGLIPNATGQRDRAIVSWDTEDMVPGVRMTAYVVTAHDTNETRLPDVVHTVTASDGSSLSATFTAAELAGGKWKWAITPKFRSWTGAESPLSNPELAFPAATPATALAKAVTVVTSDEATRTAASITTPVESTPSPSATTEPGAGKAAAETTTSVPEKSTTPERTESPKADPTPSDTSSEVDPSPSGSASE